MSNSATLKQIVFTEESSDVIARYCEVNKKSPEEVVSEWIDRMRKAVDDDKWKELEVW